MTSVKADRDLHEKNAQLRKRQTITITRREQVDSSIDPVTLNTGTVHSSPKCAVNEPRVTKSRVIWGREAFPRVSRNVGIDVEYGDVIWHGTTSANAQLIERIQYHCALVVSGAVKGSSYSSTRQELRSQKMYRRLVDALFVVLVISVAFVCGQRTATPVQPEGGATNPSGQVIVLQAERGRVGHLSSPGFPDNYPIRRSITWRIESTSYDDVVHLAFDHFDLERPTWRGNCSYDSVTVQILWEKLPPEMESTSSVLTIVFMSDARVTRSGFSARYWATESTGLIEDLVPALASGHFIEVPMPIPDEFYNYCRDLDFERVTIPNFYGHESADEILTSRQWQEMTTVDTSSTNGSLFDDIDCTGLPTAGCVNLEPSEDCYYGNGENYRGMGTLPEESGQTCLNWTDVLGPVKTRFDWADPQENYCRTIWSDTYPEPFCFVTRVWDGQEYPFPEPCGLKPCDEPGCGPPPNVESGSRSPIQNFYRVGEKVFISCDVGYVIEQEEEDMWITCTEGGTWSKENLRCSVDHRLELANTLLAKDRYSPQLAPSRDQVRVIFEAAVVEIIDADEKNENMFASIAFRLRWKDNRLSWTPTKYGRVSELVVTTKDVWIPKVYLRRNGDAKFSDFPEAPVTVTSDGLVEWDIIDLLTTTCDLEPVLFPFDSMECPVCLGANTRVERFSCPGIRDNTSGTDEPQSHIENFMGCGEVAVSVADQWNAQWTLNVDEGVFGAGCINMQFHRIPTFHFCTTLSPVIILTLLMCITFVLPIEKGDRLSYGMTILLSMVVSLVFITDVLPAKGTMPVVALLIVVYMCMMGFFLIVTVIVIRISSRDKDLPPLVKKVFLRYVARLVFLGDLTQTKHGHTVLEVEVDSFEMGKSTMGNESKPAEADPKHLLEVLLSLKESVNGLSNAVESLAISAPPKTTETTDDEGPKTDYSKLAKVLDRLCLILYVFGLIIAIPIVRFSAGDN
ncbi:Carboxylesterase 5A [Branchiostoma belcheri]|nr:Carboxylesterase 5A [Branchiostoma belcheri]